MRRRTMLFWRNNITSEHGLWYARGIVRVGVLEKMKEAWRESYGGGRTSIGESFMRVVGEPKEGEGERRDGR